MVRAIQKNNRAFILSRSNYYYISLNTISVAIEVCCFQRLKWLEPKPDKLPTCIADAMKQCKNTFTPLCAIIAFSRITLRNGLTSHFQPRGKSSVSSESLQVAVIRFTTRTYLIMCYIRLIL